MESKDTTQSKTFSDLETATERSLSISEKEKTNGMIAYITIIGFIIAFIQNQEIKSEHVNYHIRQMLGLICLSFGSFIVGFIPFLGWIASPIVAIGVFVFWIMGLIGATNGERKPVPILGEQFQEWFAGVSA